MSDWLTDWLMEIPFLLLEPGVINARSLTPVGSTETLHDWPWCNLRAQSSAVTGKGSYSPAEGVKRSSPRTHPVGGDSAMLDKSRGDTSSPWTLSEFSTWIKQGETQQSLRSGKGFLIQVKNTANGIWKGESEERGTCAEATAGNSVTGRDAPVSSEWAGCSVSSENQRGQMRPSTLAHSDSVCARLPWQHCKSLLEIVWKMETHIHIQNITTLENKHSECFFGHKI